MRLPALLQPYAALRPLAFPLAAALAWFAQHVLAAALILGRMTPIEADADFWLLPLKRAALLPGQPLWAVALALAGTLLSCAALALLVFQRANAANRGHLLAAFACIPGVQLPILATAALLRRRDTRDENQTRRAADITLGLLTGIGVIVLAALVSAVLFGAYGWAMFVATPFTVGLATGWFANRGRTLVLRRTLGLVMAATTLGTLALVMFALEGLLCILMAAPLGAGVAALGGMLGRRLAQGGRRREARMMSASLLPAMLLLDVALPPAVLIPSRQSMDIRASPAAVWGAVVSDAVVARPPGLIAAAGLAYPIRSELRGRGVGAERLGHFSTGIARERVTAWHPQRALAFQVLSQPPAMAEMSPYREVHAPHVTGYFTTRETRFDLTPLPGGGTRLTVSGTHVLRMDPALYWEPLARLAIRLNVARVLADIDVRSRATPSV